MWIFQSNHPLLPSISAANRFRVQSTMEAYPQPDRLRHLLSQTRFGTGMENPVPQRPSNEGLHEPAKTTPLSQDCPRAAPRTSSRKEMRSAAPKVPSIDEPPFEGRAPRRCPPFPAWQPLRYDAFFFLRAPRLDNAGDRQDSAASVMVITRR